MDLARVRDPETDADAVSGVLLMSDIVDSVRLIESLGDARWAPLWRDHDRAARELLQRCAGTEIEKTDGFLLLFSAAAQAAAFALGYHAALERLSVPLHARVGLHVGPFSLRRNADADQARGAQRLELDGLSKSVVARVMALALGGQTLLSAPAQTALDRGAGATGLHLRSHGHWQLKGLAEPQEVFELAREAGAFRPPPDSAKAYRVAWRADEWRPIRELRHTLPGERDSFVGRLDALQELARRFDEGARLVSLLGIGGAGKTRLALHYGRRWLGDFDGGVWFCDLTAARGLDGVLHGVALGLELPPSTADPVVAIGQAIAGRERCLVILDNFEQVWAHAEATLGRWLEVSTEARFLVTTREALSIVGEEVMPLPPLAVADAAELFRRRAVASGSRIAEADDAAIEPLVRLLDGLPLAVELAAARTPILSPVELLARMKDRFRLLAVGGGRRDRQATLRAALDWSWDLLSEAERMALAQLSAFEGGFTLAAAEAVLDLSACADAPWAVDAVQSLVRKSFVRALQGYRFELLSSVQEYAADHLSGTGRFIGSGPQALAANQRRHWQHFAALGAPAAVAHRCADLDNLVAACRRAAAHGDTVAAVGALANAWAALRRNGPFHVALDLAAAVAGSGLLSGAQQATLDWVVGSALLVLGRADEAGQTLETGLHHALATGDARLEALLRCQRGELFSSGGEVPLAAAELQRALTLARGLGDDTLLCSVFNAQGNLAGAQGALAEAGGHFVAALALAESMHDARWAGGLHGNLGALAHEQGRFDDALHHYETALVQAESVGERRWAANTRCNLGLLHHDLGRLADAEHEFERALASARELAHSRLESTARCNLGLVAEAQGRSDEALSHYAAAVDLAARLGMKRAEGQFRTYLGRLLARRGDFEPAKQCLVRSTELLAAAGDSAGCALVDCAHAELALGQGETATARALLAKVAVPLPAGAATPMSELAREVGRLRSLLTTPPGEPGAQSTL